jgi:hypothetical protein
MPVEPAPHTFSEDVVAPHEDEVAQIHAIWQELPDTHQVALVLQLADSIMASAYRPYFRHALTQLWPVRPSELPVAFPKFEISHEDLIRANLDEEDAVQLTDAHRQEIGESMRNHYIHDLFWPELRHVAGMVLENLGNPAT